MPDSPRYGVDKTSPKVLITISSLHSLSSSTCKLRCILSLSFLSQSLLYHTDWFGILQSHIFISLKIDTHLYQHDVLLPLFSVLLVYCSAGPHAAPLSTYLWCRQQPISYRSRRRRAHVPIRLLWEEDRVPLPGLSKASRHAAGCLSCNVGSWQ